MVIYFTRYYLDTSVTMLNLYHDELIGNIEEYKGNKYLMVDDYTWDKVLDKIKGIGIKNLDNIKILIDTDDRLPEAITLKNAVILITCVIKDADNKFKHNVKHLKKI